MTLRSLAAAALPLLLATVLAGCDRPPARPRAGDAIDFSLATLDGTQVSSTAWRGRTVVLNVWASWCAPCRQEMASLDALSRALDPARAIVVGITVDEDPNLASEYLLRERISFASLADGAAHVAREQLQVTSLPSTLVIGPDGRLRARFVGPRDWTDPELLAQIRLDGLRSDPRALPPRAPDAAAPAQLPAT